VVKVNAPERLRAELARKSWQGEHVALGTNTDPYQWVEKRYELMRGIWGAFREARNPCSVLTKSPLLLRDLDLMRELSAVTDFSAALSIPTLDRKAWRATEPRSPNPRARLDAVAELARAGIKSGVLVAPLMPGINDSPEQVREVVRLATEAGAGYISGIALHLRRGVREVFMEWLSEHRPELVAPYDALYRRGAYLPAAERQRLIQLLEGPGAPPRGRPGRVLATDPETTEDTRRAYPEPAQPRLF
jgi:DNA repair photolyase